MKENDGILCANPHAAADAMFDLGTWLGRHQALGWIASKCSAADARALQTIRENKIYLVKAPSWDDFCGRYTGVSRKTADNIIDRLQEFGETYFNLSQIVSINIPEYRALAPAVQNEEIEFDGERIPVTRANCEKLTGAVRKLREQLASQRQPFAALRERLDRCLGEIAGAMRRGVAGAERDELVALLDEVSTRITELYVKL